MQARRMPSSRHKKRKGIDADPSLMLHSDFIVTKRCNREHNKDEDAISVASGSSSSLNRITDMLGSSQQTVLQSLENGCIGAPVSQAMMEEAKAAARNVKKHSSSALRGVTRHSSTGKWEAHLWDGSYIRTKKESGNRSRGRQVYLGGWSSELAAATAYDLGALWFWGQNAQLNFPLERYHMDIPHLEQMTQDSFVATLKRHSTGFARGQSRYRGVTRHHQQGKFEARIGLAHGNKYMYLGTFPSEEEAAKCYDKAALELRGPKKCLKLTDGPHLTPPNPNTHKFKFTEAVTNFPAVDYAPKRQASTNEQKRAIDGSLQNASQLAEIQAINKESNFHHDSMRGLPDHFEFAHTSLLEWEMTNDDRSYEVQHCWNACLKPEMDETGEEAAKVKTSRCLIQRPAVINLKISDPNLDWHCSAGLDWSGAASGQQSCSVSNTSCNIGGTKLEDVVYGSIWENTDNLFIDSPNATNQDMLEECLNWDAIESEPVKDSSSAETFDFVECSEPDEDFCQFCRSFLQLDSIPTNPPKGFHKRPEEHLL